MEGSGSDSGITAFAEHWWIYLIVSGVVFTIVSVVLRVVIVRRRIRRLQLLKAAAEQQMQQQQIMQGQMQAGIALAVPVSSNPPATGQPAPAQPFQPSQPIPAESGMQISLPAARTDQPPPPSAYDCNTRL
uniref:Uncharacterized protein n=1 Tax=Palpitomonas bilix TaxID=652834 RepID=A0A7S3G5K6_9EUKA|mmetsp:Transcript_31032/g.81455  ORF Transcript_31032/g.81455 Transcript_31032/m.81455 type:complete len:131 (+) Transcript_31032:234-626(+)|eukprot:CAMPEP_0113880760 /NCGR_PEP_ID=MMETSP0780_2-20120614/7971_1 /TAXON_ID=652834 /ORGANISM="Palpitomonas bilix" /LENGTH=130 /DNA_ID=CAMNT_0000867485 /DNA_START=295 /DNA_END=687 /DNA_ORIENTATION=- /assembly_acc=CAM_ASM_000599